MKKFSPILTAALALHSSSIWSHPTEAMHVHEHFLHDVLHWIEHADPIFIVLALTVIGLAWWVKR